MEVVQQRCGPGRPRPDGAVHLGRCAFLCAAIVVAGCQSAPNTLLPDSLLSQTNSATDPTDTDTGNASDDEIATPDADAQDSSDTSDESNASSEKQEDSTPLTSKTAFETLQPTQKKIQLVARGDEHFNWYEDVHGYTVVLDCGAYHYATLDEHGHLVPTDRLVGDSDPSEVVGTPGVLPAADVLEQIRASSDAKPISYESPRKEEIHENFTVLEGDMIVPEEFLRDKSDKQSAVYYTVGVWTGGIVPYAFDSNVNATNQTRARQAMDDWEAVANVQFVPRTSEANYIYLFSGSGNWSYVGSVGGRQDISIYNWTYEFIIAHELAHALGFWHEQSRSDRDSHITINWSNITSGYASNFDIHNAWYDADVGTYNFDSIMHYDAYAFSNNGQPTIQVKPAYAGTTFGQRNHLSLGDAEAMATIYGSGTPSARASMTSPASNGATLTGSSYTFQWNAGTNVTEYWLWLGSTAQGNDILSQSQGTNLSKTVTGLPTDGRTIYVRLLSKIGGAWQQYDYAYVCHTAVSQKSSMTTPASSGATLTGSSYTFQWDAGTNVSEYWLWVGSSAGANDMYSQSAGTNQSRTVSGLPTDGRTVYVRLFSLISGQWQTNDYSYVCQTAVSAKAAMSAPASNGATLSGSSHTFQWSTGTNVTQYWLWVGSGAGFNDMYSQSGGTSTSKTVAGLPTDGRTVYVRLFSLIAGQWQTNDYSYICQTVASARAAMTTPASSGATLTGASFTFQWTTGTNVTEYWVWVGSSSASNDMYSQSAGTSTSRTITGLPTDGRTIYVRLFSLIAGQWQSNDYSYVCAIVASAKAAMTTPASNGATLTGAGFTFQWTTGTSVAEYWLWIGSAVGGNDMYSQSGGTSTSKTVAGLPVDGRTIYVRLFSLIAGQWQTNDYSYVCSTASGTKAAMTAPASNGATLSGSSFTFQWDTGVSVTEYWLWVGTGSATSHEILSQSQGLGQSKTVTGLPMGGQTVYVRLFSMIGGAWQYTDYTYVASGG